MSKHFTVGTFEFLAELSRNNDREWFQENKDKYEAKVIGPAISFLEELEKPLRKVAPMLQIDAKPHGGSIMRIYRDTRFSKDKTPYKTNLGMSLRHQADADIHAPGGYIHIAPQECFVGVGCWHPPRKELAAIRKAIDANSKAWTKAVEGRRFAEVFELGGESLKTAPRDYAKDHPQIEHLKRKDFIGLATMKRSEVLGTDLVEQTIDLFKRAKPMMSFLCDAVGIPY